MLPPDGSQTQFRPSPPSNLCSLGLPPHLVTVILRHIIGEHFAQRENIENPELRDLLWRARDVGNILIESITRFKPEELGERPAVLIADHDWTATRLFPDNQYGTTPQGDPQFMQLMQGSHTCFCISRSGQEAKILAAEVYLELRGFAQIIRQTLSLTRFAVMGIGRFFQLEEATDNYASPVDIAYTNQDSWTVYQDAPRLRRFDISARDLAP